LDNHDIHHAEKFFMKVIILLILAMFIALQPVRAQLFHDPDSLQFTRADTLRGMLTPLRTCYDLTYYHLSVEVDTVTRSIQGSNEIMFNAVSDFDTMQIDLFLDMKIEKIVDDRNQPLSFTREFGAVFVAMGRTVKKGTITEITVFYSGTPQVAKRPPWDGGFVWAHDSTGNLWLAVTCQGTGASLWWPCKDHQSDKPDSMLLSITIPSGLMDISNGRLRDTVSLSGGKTQWNWFISYPINNYNVTLNVGKFSHFGDAYIGRFGDTLTLDYYVMPYNLEKAKIQFRQVKLMLACYEKYFGDYPFVRDGYKLIESPHLGMEHQSAIAYGNKYLNGYLGRSWSAEGLDFDFIIMHESAHEWWGNSVTARDIADMWFHEGFATYAEALYIESTYGLEASLHYLNNRKQDIHNEEPVIGRYNVNNEGSGDMYPKGALFLNTLRHVIANDSLWWQILRGIQSDFKYGTISTDELVQYFNRMTHQDLSYMFDQYLRYPKIPTLDITVTKYGDSVYARYRWEADVPDFRMPVLVTTAKDTYGFIYPTTEWKVSALGDIDPQEFNVATDLFYIDVRKSLQYFENGSVYPRPRLN
jgi:aminopeptidase N